MANVDDTNVLFRTDYASLEYVKQCASSVLLLGGAETPEGINELVRLNEDFIKRNISPGGCAAVSYTHLDVYKRQQLYHT